MRPLEKHKSGEYDSERRETDVGEYLRRVLVGSVSAKARTPDTFDLKSPEFKDMLPKKYFCNEILPTFPLIIWEGVADRTKSFSLSFYSVERSKATPFYYFILYNIPRTVMRVDSFNYNEVGRFGKNSLGDTDYAVPCRSNNKNRRYVFHLSAYEIDNLLMVTEKEEIDPEEIQRITNKYSIFNKYLIAREMLSTKY